MGCSGEICDGTSAAAVWGSITTAGPFGAEGARLEEQFLVRQVVLAVQTVQTVLVLSLFRAPVALSPRGARVRSWPTTPWIGLPSTRRGVARRAWLQGKPGGQAASCQVKTLRSAPVLRRRRIGWTGAERAVCAVHESLGGCTACGAFGATVGPRARCPGRVLGRWRRWREE